MGIILASGSHTRKKILEDAGIQFKVIPPHVDEDAIKAALLHEQAKMRDIVDYLAEVKALTISNSYEQEYVLGADQILILNNVLMSKAPTMEAAAERIKDLAGKTHTLLTASIIARDGKVLWRSLDRADLTMKELSNAEIQSYIERAGKDILSSVGCYQIESFGGDLFDRIEGDYFGILGLNKDKVLNQLALYGIVAA